jgi:hypothetical protein
MTSGKTLLAVIVLLAFTPAIQARPRSAQPIAVFQLQPHPGGTHMITLRATVRSHEGNFVFDTGGGVTYISPAFAQTIGCKPWGQLSGFVLTGQRLDMQRCDKLDFDIDGWFFRAPIAGVFDLMKFMPPNVPKIDGSIGLDLFAGRAVTLSLADRTLTVESAASLRQRQRKGKEISIRLVRELEGIALAVVVGVMTPEGTAWMELDSGNGGANVIAKHIAPLLNLKTDVKGPQPAKFMLVGGIPVTGDARVNETLIMDGNIGTRFMIDWDVTFDLAKGRAWVTPVSKQKAGGRSKELKTEN